MSTEETTSTPRLPLKREREEDNEIEDPSKQTTLFDSPPLSGEKLSKGSPMDQEVNMSSSVEILDAESDDSVIDLTQEM